jgi:hypothetical protein
MNDDELEVSGNTEVETTAEVNPGTEVAAEDKVSSTSSEENVSGEKASHREYTPEERAAYSFRKQLAKQREKYEKNYVPKDQYEQLLQRIEKLENPEKFQPLNRQQFQDDDSYIDALVQQRFDNMWNQRLQEAQQRYSEQARQEQEVQAYKSRQDENVKKLFKTPEAEKQYRDAIAVALQNGLGELVDSDREIAQYIMRSDLGPKILYEFATNPKEVENLFNDGVTEMDRQFKIRELESRLRNEINKPAMPVVGKPGMGAETKPGSIFDSDDSILNYLRTH